MKISVIVKTGSKKGPLVETISDTLIRVFLREKPHDNEANDALIKLLSKHYNLPKAAINIVAGAKSHVKIVEI